MEPPHSVLNPNLAHPAQFPSLQSFTSTAHANGLTAGWYHNNCRCHDHCTSPLCFAADVNATIALGAAHIHMHGAKPDARGFLQALIQ